MDLHIPDDLAAELLKRAEAGGDDPEKFAIRAIEQSLADHQSLSALLAPVREAFRASGMDEDEAVDLFEAEKHAMRAERRAASS